MYKLVFIALVIAAVAAVLSKLQANKKSFTPPKAKRLLTKNEQPMYFRLAETFPGHVVLAQVSLGALLQSPNRATRNRYDRKMADFVLCTKAFDVIAIVELDDSSHNGKENRDEARDKLLNAAGYKTLRYKRVPDIATLKTDISLPTAC
ncbi:DUF2726 domain-containing protein [Duganella sp. Dugasp56]|uniref:DUF2726 domain-containing protein n=1 Tax=Duganella sp. Dugasp56 TaxID=3243046 RepID=UPI0039AFFFA5